MELNDLSTTFAALVDAIDREAAVASKGRLVDLIAFFQTVNEGYDEIDAQRKRLYALVDNLNKNAVPDALDAAGVDLFRVPELGRSFYTINKLSVSIVPDKRDDAYEWLKSNQGGELIQPTVNAGTLSSFIRQRQKDDNLDPPTDLFKLNAYRITGSSKYTPK